MTPEELEQVLRGVVADAVGAGEVRAEVPERVVVTPPGAGGSGDWSTAVALRLAAQAGMPSTRVAALLAARLRSVPVVDAVEVTGPGFLNVTLAEGSSAGGVAAAGGCAVGVVLGPPARWVDAARMPWTLANPVLRVQLAHARLAACAASGSSAAGATRIPDATSEVVAALSGFPAAMERATTAREPSVLGRALERLASAALAWLESVDRTGPDDADTRLAVAARDALADGLRILDVAAPDRI